MKKSRRETRLVIWLKGEAAEGLVDDQSLAEIGFGVRTPGLTGVTFSVPTDGEASWV